MTTVPGFTADASLYRSAERYREEGSVAPLTNGGAAVVPQICFPNGAGGTTCCTCYFGYCYCTPRVHFLQ